MRPSVVSASKSGAVSPILKCHLCTSCNDWMRLALQAASARGINVPDRIRHPRAVAINTNECLRPHSAGASLRVAQNTEERLSISASPCILGAHALGGGFRLCAPTFERKAVAPTRHEPLDIKGWLAVSLPLRRSELTASYGLAPSLRPVVGDRSCHVECVSSSGNGQLPDGRVRCPGRRRRAASAGTRGRAHGARRGRAGEQGQVRIHRQYEP